MHDSDPDTGDERPSRSARRREALDVLDFARRLSELSAARLDPLRLPDAVRAQLATLQRTPSHIARKRELGHLAKLLRGCDDAELAPARAALAEDRATGVRAAAALHRVEALRTELLDAADDAALNALVAAHPGSDRQRLRALVRQARRERDAGQPPRAQRELFRLLRAMLDDAG